MTPADTSFAHRLRVQTGSLRKMSRKAVTERSISAIKGSTFGAVVEDSPRTLAKEGKKY